MSDEIVIRGKRGGAHDYNLDNIIEMRVRPIIMNAEYVG